MFEKLRQSQGIPLEGLYTITLKKIKANGGSLNHSCLGFLASSSSLLPGNVIASDYNDIIPEMVQAAYPEHNWMRWKFNKVPKDWWALRANQRLFVDWLGQALSIIKLEEWYTITSKSFSEHGGTWHLTCWLFQSDFSSH